MIAAFIESALSPSSPSDGTGRGAASAPTGAEKGVARANNEEKVKTFGESNQPLPCGSRLPSVVVLFLPPYLAPCTLPSRLPLPITGYETTVMLALS